MNPEKPAELLKHILENLHSPERLDKHPWAQSQFVQAYVLANPQLEQQGLGYRLVMAVGSLYLELLPTAAPKRGKRLDTQWGMFGLLAGQYFAPLLFGLPYPGSLREAWGKIDRAILLCRFGKQADGLSAEEIERYRLVGAEPEIAPLSTLSDWHVKGIAKLAVLIQDREQHLMQMILEIPDKNKIAELPFPIPTPVFTKKRSAGLPRRLSDWVITTLFLILLILAASKIWNIYQLVQPIRADAVRLQALVSTPPSLEKIRTAGSTLSQFRQHINLLYVEALPLTHLTGAWLEGMPVYGVDMASSTDLLELAWHTTAAADISYQAAAPILDWLQNGSATINPQQFVRLLLEARPQLFQARQELDRALTLRSGLNGKVFSPRTQSLLDQIDPMLTLLDNGLSAATALPDLLGAGNSGPRSYMLLVQNEDELRPTGGFISSVGTFLVKNGNLFGLQFEEVSKLEDWSLPYPEAPWQLSLYMNSPVLVLRDANWFTDYPTAVEWIEYLYAYTHKHTVDGVIAIDQQMLVSVLQVIGPLTLDGISTPVTSENVIGFMRNAKVPPPNAPPDWYRKAFISQIASALVDKLLSNQSINWPGLAQMMLRSLNERHIMLQVDDPRVSDLLAKLDLDGAIRPGLGDFLMVVDTNVGFYKTNAVVESKLSYDVDLTDINKPVGSLVVFHTNHAHTQAVCNQWNLHRPDQYYPMNTCYWNYLRIYVPRGTELKTATPHAVPAQWMLLGKPVPAQVDTLEEEIPGVHGFGTMLVVPGSQALDTSFQYLLPAEITRLDPRTNRRIYTLKIKKQPGTLSVPVTIRLHLPASAHVEQISSKAIVDGRNVLIETNLTTDLSISVTFSVP